MNAGLITSEGAVAAGYEHSALAAIFSAAATKGLAGALGALWTMLWPIALILAGLIVTITIITALINANQESLEKHTKAMEAESEAAKKRTEQMKAEKEAIARIIEALHTKGQADKYLIAMKYLDTMKEMTSGKDNKIVYMPYEASAVLSSVDGIKEMLDKK